MSQEQRRKVKLSGLRSDNPQLLQRCPQRKLEPGQPDIAIYLAGAVGASGGPCPDISHLRFAHARQYCRMYGLLILAVLLMIAWVVLRVALAVTGALFHLLWIAAIVLVVIWLLGWLRGKR
jgi:hypothetical protein